MLFQCLQNESTGTARNSNRDNKKFRENENLQNVTKDKIYFLFIEIIFIQKYVIVQNLVVSSRTLK